MWSTAEQRIGKRSYVGEERGKEKDEEVQEEKEEEEDNEEDGEEKCVCVWGWGGRRRSDRGSGRRKSDRGSGRRRSEGRRGWRSLHAVILLYLFLSSLSELLLASDGCQGDLLVIHCNQ